MLQESRQLSLKDFAADLVCPRPTIAQFGEEIGWIAAIEVWG